MCTDMIVSIYLRQKNMHPKSLSHYCLVSRTPEGKVRIEAEKPPNVNILQHQLWSHCHNLVTICAWAGWGKDREGASKLNTGYLTVMASGLLLHSISDIWSTDLVMFALRSMAFSKLNTGQQHLCAAIPTPTVPSELHCWELLCFSDPDSRSLGFIPQINNLENLQPPKNSKC